MATTLSNKGVWMYVGVATLFFVFINLAYINYAWHATPEARYTGANPYTAADKLVYMSMVQQGREGLLFMKNLHTTEPQLGRIFSPQWFLVGQTGRLLGISNNAAYQSHRIAFSLAFLVMLYAFLHRLFPHVRERMAAVGMVLFSGGLGWFVLSIHPEILQFAETTKKFLYSPTDLYVTEGTTLLNFSQSPLFALSQLLMVIIFFCLVQWRNQHNWKLNLTLGVIVAALTVMHPYDAPIVLAVAGSWTVWRVWRTRDWRPLYRFGWILAGSALALGYNAYLVSTEPVIAEWLKQNLVYSPPLHLYLWGYGLLIPLWLVGVGAILKTQRRDPWWMMALAWSVIPWLLLYLPIDLNRRFVNSLHIALAIVAFVGSRYLYCAIRRFWLRIVYGGFAVLALGSHLVMFLIINLYFAPGVYEYGYYYITDDEERMLTFLSDATRREDLLLTSDMKTSFTITSQVNRAVFRGHDHQTPNVHLVKQELQWFFSATEGDSALRRRREFIQRHNFDYVVVNHSRLPDAPVWLSDASFLAAVYDTPAFTIYRVTS